MDEFDNTEEFDPQDPPERLTAHNCIPESKLEPNHINCMTQLCKMIWESAKEAGCDVWFAVYRLKYSDRYCVTISRVNLNHSLFALGHGNGSEVILSNTNRANSQGMPEEELNVYHSLGCEDDGTFHLYPDAETIPFVVSKEWWTKFFSTILEECTRLEQVAAVRDIKKSMRTIISEQQNS